MAGIFGFAIASTSAMADLTQPQRVTKFEIAGEVCVRVGLSSGPVQTLYTLVVSHPDFDTLAERLYKASTNPDALVVVEHTGQLSTECPPPYGLEIIDVKPAH